MSWFLDGLALLFILFLGYNGFKKGLIEEFGRLMGLILAVTISISKTTELEIKLKEIIHLQDWAVNFLSFTILFTATLLISRLITKMFHIALLSKSNQSMNRTLGFTFGLIKGFFITTIFIWFITLLPLRKWTMIIEKNSKIAKLGNEVRISVVDFFNWEDPILIGESYIKQITQP
tara:strand:- start:458 stop:985 length:528 start_codon:yes stop_codon:yes gene_type:complete